MCRITVPVLTSLLCAVPLGCGSGQSTQGGSGQSTSDEAALARCLPEGISLSTSLATVSHGPGDPRVRDKLKELGAHARNGRLFDASGKEIRFFQLYVPSGTELAVFTTREDEQRRHRSVQKQEQELQELRRRYNVIVITHTNY